MAYLIILALIAFVMLCIRKAYDPAPIFTDTERRPKPISTKPLPLITFTTTNRLIQSVDHEPKTHTDDECFFI